MRVVMTGAAGGVGTMTRPHLVGHFDQIVVSDRREITELHEGETFVQADLTDMAAMERLLEGADGIIHLGGQPVEADWEAVHSANIVGLYNTYEAARRQGCTRIVFATTNHVVGFYRRQQTIDHLAMPRPDSRYGVSKAFGEALGRMYADKYGLRVFNIRIGNVDHTPADVRRLSIWISPRDSPSCSGSGSPIRRSTSRSSTALPGMRAPGGTTRMPTAWVSTTGRSRGLCGASPCGDPRPPRGPHHCAVSRRPLLRDRVRGRRTPHHMIQLRRERRASPTTVYCHRSTAAALRIVPGR